jgi:uncharacterized protein YdeI (YjbR/CyaY-like superfamily)
MKKDPRVDAYIETVGDFARPIFAHIRKLAHAAMPDGAETLKWGKPTFAYKDKNVATFAAFKQHAMLAVHGTGRQGDGGEGGKLTSVADLPSDAELTKSLTDACARIDAEGSAIKRKTPPRPRPDIPMPADFAAALERDPKATATFEGFAKSHRREYLEWITEAKREETRAKRISESVEWLAEGKTRMWKYGR